MRFLPSLRQRQKEPEIMDQPDLEKDRHIQALQGLQRINRWSASAGILWPSLRQLARQSSAPLRILDVATGGGDIPIRLWDKARRAGVRLELSACDISETALEHARQSAAKVEAKVEFFQCNILEQPLRQKYDVVISSLFLHHLEEDQAVDFLRRVSEAAEKRVLINDLRRCLRGWLLAQAGSRLLTTSPVVHVDGPLSVRAAFTIPEVKALAQRAGWENIRIRQKWPFRFLLSCAASKRGRESMA